MKLTDLIKREHLDKAAYTGADMLGESFDDSVLRMLPFIPLVEECRRETEKHGVTFHTPTAMSMMNWIDRAIQIASLEERAKRQ